MTLPEKLGERNSAIFRLARGVKYNCGMKGAPKAELKLIVRDWHQLALPVIGTPEFDQTWRDFLHAFSSARLPLEKLIDLVMRSINMERLPTIASSFESWSTKRLIGLCAGLAELHPQKKFFLTCADIALRIPDFTAMSAWRTLRMLEVEDVIKNEDRGDERHAARFRWTGGIIRD
jgi:hypothetical protein